MSSFRRRQARRSDAAAVVELVRAFDTALLGASEYGPAELEAEWRDLDPERDAWVVEEADRLVGYGTVSLDGADGEFDGYVHPDAGGRGLGGELVMALEQECRDRGAVRALSGVLAVDEPAQALLRGLGYTETRRFWQMRIALAGPPPGPIWPAGFAVSTLDPADLPAFHAAAEEAFADHWNHTHEPLERFRRRFVETDDYDPTLWRVVRDGGEIAAGWIGRTERLGVGWVARLFTRRPWRGRGLGAALLADAFATYWKRGQPAIGLGVDAQSATGAQRLYERAGMHVHWAAVVFEKALR